MAAPAGHSVERMKYSRCALRHAIRLRVIMRHVFNNTHTDTDSICPGP